MNIFKCFFEFEFSMFYYVLHILIQKPGFCSEKKNQFWPKIWKGVIILRKLLKVYTMKSHILKRIYYKTGLHENLHCVLASFFWSSYPRVTYRKVSKSQKLFFLKLHGIAKKCDLSFWQSSALASKMGQIIICKKTIIILIYY